MTIEKSTEVKSIELDLGPFYLVLHGKIVGHADNLVLDIAEATEEDIKELKETQELILRTLKDTGTLLKDFGEISVASDEQDS